MGRGVDGRLDSWGSNPAMHKIFCYNFLKLFRIIPLIQYTFVQWWNWAVVGRLGSVGVKTSFSYTHLIPWWMEVFLPLDTCVFVSSGWSYQIRCVENKLQDLRVTSGCEEVETGVDTSVVVGMKRSLHFQLLLKIRFKLLVNVVNDRLVTATAHSIYHPRSKGCTVFINVHLCDCPSSQLLNRYRYRHKISGHHPMVERWISLKIAIRGCITVNPIDEWNRRNMFTHVISSLGACYCCVMKFFKYIWT